MTWTCEAPTAGPRNLGATNKAAEAKHALQKFLAARRPECPLCGSTQWSSPQIITVDYKDMGGIYEQVSAKSPCGHIMHFSLQTLRACTKKAA